MARFKGLYAVSGQTFQRLIIYPLSETTTVGENIIVEKGTTVVWLNHYFHHNPDLYSEPMSEFLLISWL